MPAKISVNKTSETIEFVVKNKYKSIVKNVNHIFYSEGNDYSKYENYWLIDFYLEDYQRTYTYRIDASYNFLSKCYKFQQLIKKKLKMNKEDFKKLVGLRLNVEFERSYILKKTDGTWNVSDDVLYNMSFIKEDSISKCDIFL